MQKDLHRFLDELRWNKHANCVLVQRKQTFCKTPKQYLALGAFLKIWLKSHASADVPAKAKRANVFWLQRHLLSESFIWRVFGLSDVSRPETTVVLLNIFSAGPNPRKHLSGQLLPLSTNCVWSIKTTNPSRSSPATSAARTFPARWNNATMKRGSKSPHRQVDRDGRDTSS